MMTKLRIRKLTPRECFRLMGFDDEDEQVLTDNGISNTQKYKMAGNSIVVNVLESIFEILLKGKEDNLRVLSLFSGIGAFEKALERLDINYELVNYCEIDKYAAKAYSLIHKCSEDKNLGDITKIDISKLPKDIDLISHGSPCQDFSISGLGKGGEKGSGTRSSLMWNTVDIVKETQPKYVIWENVKNLLSKKHRHNFEGYLEIMEQLGYNNYYAVLNASDYGIPQHRERVFTISIRKDIDKQDFYFQLPRPLDKVLEDLLEDEVDEKYFLSQKMIDYISATGTKTFNNNNSEINLDIARPVTTDQNKRAGTTNYVSEDLPKKCDLSKVNRLGGIFDNEDKKHQAGSVYDKNGLAPTLDIMQGGYRQPLVVEEQKKNQIGVIVEKKGG